MKLHIDLFSGIGGFSVAADAVWPGIHHVFCEIDPFCRAVLKKHWPDALLYEDIKSFSTNAKREGHSWIISEEGQTAGCHTRPFILSGGVPCQPASVAGRRQGTQDDRWLWPETFTVIRNTLPEWIILENVRGILSLESGMVFENLCVELEGIGYEVQTIIIPACAVGAPHRRDRVWIIGHANHDGLNGSEDVQSRVTRSDCDAPWAHEDGEPAGSALSRSAFTNADAKDTIRERSGRGMEGDGQILESRRAEIENARSGWEMDWQTAATRLCVLDDGISDRLVRPDGSGDAKTPRPKGWRNAALKAAGNAIVPEVAKQIMHAIKSVNL